MRLELTKRGDYAVRAMIALARDDAGLLSARRSPRRWRSLRASSRR